MDIRQAKRPQGTVPPPVITPEPQRNVTEAVKQVVDTSTATDEHIEDEVIRQYMKQLNENGITKDDIHSILDALITGGNVSWKTEILGKISVEFKVREVWASDRIVELLDEATQDNNKVSTLRFNNLVSLYNTAASLIQYKDRKFTTQKPEDLDIVLDFVNHLPFIVQDALVKKLALFDRCIAVATSDWAVKNFTEPPQAG